MKKTEDDIFVNLTELDDDIVSQIAEKYPDSNKTEIKRIFRKTTKKLNSSEIFSDKTEIVSNTDKIKKFCCPRSVSIAAAFLIVAASVPGMYFAMRNMPADTNNDNDLPIITKNFNNSNMTGASENSAPTNNNNAAIAEPTEKTTVTTTYDPDETNDHTTTTSKTTKSVNTVEPEKTTSTTVTTTTKSVNTTEPEKTTSTAVTTTMIWSNTNMIQIPITTVPIQDPNIPHTQRKLTKDDVIRLSHKGDSLTWSDFEGYEYTDIGSGLFVWKFIIDDNLKLYVGGGGLKTTPAYIHLKKADGRYIDIRYDDPEDFICDIHKPVYARREKIRSGALSSNTPRLTLEQAQKIISNAGEPNGYYDIDYSLRIIEAFDKICGCPDVKYPKLPGDYTAEYHYWLDDDGKEMIIVHPDQTGFYYADNRGSSHPWINLIPSQANLDG